MLPRALSLSLPLASLLLLPALTQCKPPVPAAQESTGAGAATNRAALRTPLTSRPGSDERTAEPRERGERALPTPDGRAFHRCFREDTTTSQVRPLGALLDRSGELYDQGTQLLGDRRGPDKNGDKSGGPGQGSLPPRADALLRESLTCAEEAARGEPRSVEAHHARALALQELQRMDEARDAFTRALALDPDDPETLAGAADLYINRLAPGLDHTETGLEYARRGSRRAKRTRDKGLIARLALLEGQALNDLGRSREALMRLDAALAATDDIQVRYERAVALFDLCRFDDARRAFEEVVARAPEDAWAHHHLGMVLEALSRQTDADRHFELARKQAPRDFQAPLGLSPQEFRALVDKEASGLPPELREDLSKVSLETADLPDLTDLTAEEPPLSPTILGLFRGTPLNEAPPAGLQSSADRGAAADEQRTIIVYRRNLLRAVTSLDELRAQVRTTLLHELGHLHGEDDEILRARGLE